MSFTWPCDLMDDMTRDWHIHTWYSDGTMSPDAVTRWACQHGLSEIAVTDHDGVDGIDEAVQAGRVHVIPGIELSTELDGSVATGTGLHILGYGIDWKDTALRNTCEVLRESRRERNRRMLQTLADMGYPLSMQEMTVRDGQDYIGKPNIARAMVRRGYIQTTQEAFRNILSHPALRAIRKKKITSHTAIRLIHQAGGKAVLAHPGLVRHIGDRGSDRFFSHMEQILDQLNQYGLDGLECDYAAHHPLEKKRFAEMAKQRGWSITRGSDFHGDDSHPGFAPYQRKKHSEEEHHEDL